MNIRLVAVFIGIGLLGCASQPTVPPNAPNEGQPKVQAPAEPTAVAETVPTPVEAPLAEPATAPELPAPDATPQPVAVATATEKKKAVPAKPPANLAKPAPAVDAAPPTPPAPAAMPTQPATPTPAAYSGPDACTLATKGNSSVAAACAKGGIKEARKEMKRMVKKAKDAGHKTDCDDCHPDDDFGKLTNEGREKFKELARMVAL